MAKKTYPHLIRLPEHQETAIRDLNDKYGTTFQSFIVKAIEEKLFAIQTENYIKSQK